MRDRHRALQAQWPLRSQCRALMQPGEPWNNNHKKKGQRSKHLVCRVYSINAVPKADLCMPEMHRERYCLCRNLQVLKAGQCYCAGS